MCSSHQWREVTSNLRLTKGILPSSFLICWLCMKNSKAQGHGRAQGKESMYSNFQEQSHQLANHATVGFPYNQNLEFTCFNCFNTNHVWANSILKLFRWLTYNLGNWFKCFNIWLCWYYRNTDYNVCLMQNWDNVTHLPIHFLQTLLI